MKKSYIFKQLVLIGCLGIGASALAAESTWLAQNNESTLQNSLKLLEQGEGPREGYSVGTKIVEDKNGKKTGEITLKSNEDCENVKTRYKDLGVTATCRNHVLVIEIEPGS